MTTPDTTARPKMSADMQARVGKKIGHLIRAGKTPSQAAGEAYSEGRDHKLTPGGAYKGD